MKTNKFEELCHGRKGIEPKEDEENNGIAALDHLQLAGSISSFQHPSHAQKQDQEQYEASQLHHALGTLLLFASTQRHTLVNQLSQ